MKGLARAKREGWVDRIITAADRLAVEEGCYFDQKAADRVTRFFPAVLRHSKGEWAGKPFDLLPWQKEVVENIEGWKRPYGTRRCRKAYIEVPKKNGKTTFCAGYAIEKTCADGEPGAEVYTAATARAQAKICFDEAANMVKQSPALMKHLRVLRSTNHITHDKSGSKFVALSSEAGIQEGLNISCLICDEMHVWTRPLYEALKYGGAARRQPLIIHITTAGVYDPESIGWELHDYATKILNDSIDDWSFYAYIAAADKEADWKDEETWRAANPSYGETVKVDQFREAAKEAEESPYAQNSFKRYRLNLWTQQSERWLDIEAWDRAPTDVTIDEFKGQWIYGGIDLGSVSDMTSLSLLYEDKDGMFRSIGRSWVPEYQLSQAARNPNCDLYRTWVDQGHLVATPGSVTDYDFLFKEIMDFYLEHSIEEIGFDPWNSIDISNRLMNEGVPMVKVPQGYAHMSGPMKHLLKIVLGDEFAYDGSPVTRFAADNLSAKEGIREDIIPMKTAKANKIDPMTALIISVGRLIANREESVYGEPGRGIVSV